MADLARALGLDKARNRLESNSPRGPAHQDKWSEPEAFHDECDEIRRERAAKRLPPDPRRRDRGAAKATGRWSAPLHGDPAGPPEQLLVTLDSLGDALPPATRPSRSSRRAARSSTRCRWRRAATACW